MIRIIKKQKIKASYLLSFLFLPFWLLFFTYILSFQAFAQEIVLKFGTLAPSGSVWVEVVQEIANQLSQKTKERIKWISYTGGVMGDEEEMIRKIRIGQLQGGGFTINGIKKIAPELEVLDVPFMFRNEKEVDYIYEKFFDEFEKYFEQRGFKLLLFTEQGFIYWYSKNPDVKTFRDIGKTRVWAWKGERVMTSIAGILGTSPIYLQVPDVLSGLETGMIDSFQTSPMACLSLQWCKLVKVVINYPYRFEPGVVVVSKSAWDKIPKDLQDIILSIFKSIQKEASKKIRQGQAESLEKLRKMGVKFVTPPQEDIEWFRKECQEKLWHSKDAGYPHELLKKVSDELEKFRARK
jgi:TRAP-type C4-dicarboxylate transport system substrate-binding protein